MRLGWLANLVLLPLCAWALVALFDVSSAKAGMGIATWLLAAAILHDLIVLPLYSGADRGARARCPARPSTTCGSPRGCRC